MLRLALALSIALLPGIASSQSGQTSSGMNMGGMKHEPAMPSKTLTITGLNGERKSLSVEEFKTMPHTSVTVTNGHSHQQETYSGVSVKELLASVETKAADGDAMQIRRSQRMTVVVAEGTDKFQIAISVCDIDPACRSGQAIVADGLDGKPLTADGAFKLILSEDRMPARWVRNLDALTEKNLSSF